MDNIGIETQIADLRESLERELQQMRTEILGTIAHIGATAETTWIGFAFTITYVLLGIILWRIW
jgi:hypothetical protein